MKRIAFSVILTTIAFAAPVSGQLEGIYIPPQCEIDTKHFLAKQAQQYVRAASEARTAEGKEREIQDAYRTLNDAISRGEEGNGAVWYFWGRTYVLDGDFAGADSAFTRAANLLPECLEDTDSHRYNMWVSVYNVAVSALQAEDFEEALPYLMDANEIYHLEPNVPFYIAQIYAQRGDLDSGITFFKNTVEMLGDNPDTTYAGMYDVAVFNTARLYHQQSEFDSAATWYAAYRELHPEDMVSLQALAGVLEIAGRGEEALGYYAQILDRGEELEAQILFGTGVSLFQNEQYEMAAKAFTLGLGKNPYFRDGWYNLGQSYFALASPVEEEGTEPSPEELSARTTWADEMLQAAVALEGVDPLNVSSLQMLVQAYNLLGEDDSTASVFDRLNAMDFEFVVTSFAEGENGFDLAGLIVNNREETIEFSGVTISWINEAGETLLTDSIPPQTMEAQGEFEFSFSPTGEGLAAWLYETAAASQGSGEEK